MRRYCPVAYDEVSSVLRSPDARWPKLHTLRVAHVWGTFEESCGRLVSARFDNVQ